MTCELTSEFKTLTSLQLENCITTVLEVGTLKTAYTLLRRSHCSADPIVPLIAFVSSPSAHIVEFCIAPHGMLAAFKQLRVVPVRCVANTAVSPTLWHESRTLYSCKHARPYGTSPHCRAVPALPHSARQIRCYSSSNKPALLAAEDMSPGSENIPLEPALYLVGTPIGNLEDLSVRALKILQSATVILAEDTRHSRKLLNHYNIKSHMYSFHQHNEHSKQAKVHSMTLVLCVSLLEDRGTLGNSDATAPRSLLLLNLRCWSSSRRVHLWL